MLKVSEIKMSVDKVLALAKTITTIQIKLPLNLDLLTNKDDTYQKIANEIESAMKGAKKDRLWALMKDPVQPSSLDSIQKWSVGDGMNLGMGWVRDAIYKFAEDVANGNIDLPIPKNKP